MTDPVPDPAADDAEAPEGEAREGGRERPRPATGDAADAPAAQPRRGGSDTTV